MSSVVKQLAFAIIVPVQIDGESRYALSRSPSPQALAGLVAASQLPPGWHAAVSDGEHRTIARSEQQDAFVGKEVPPAQWRGAGPDVFEFTDSEGRPSLQAYASSELTGWETSVWAPRALLEAPVRAQWRTLGATALLAMVVVALASWLGRIIARSVGQAARAAIASGQGGALVQSGTPVTEVNTLMAELHETANLLRESKDRLQIAMDAAQLGRWQYDALRRVVSGDRRFKEIFDVASDKVPLEEIMKRVHPEDVERVRADLQAALDHADAKPYAHEYRVVWSDGRVRWVETHGLAYFEGVGRDRRAVGGVGTVADVTERKEREEKEHLLMREINHRAKNMLGVVHSIARQTPPKIPKISSRASPSASRRFQPTRTYSSGTNGMGSRSRTWCAPSSRTSPISLVLVSSWLAQGCA
jgi:PAS domain S-box-containing protein